MCEINFPLYGSFFSPDCNWFPSINGWALIWLTVVKEKSHLPNHFPAVLVVGQICRSSFGYPIICGVYATPTDLSFNRSFLPSKYIPFPSSSSRAMFIGWAPNGQSQKTKMPRLTPRQIMVNNLVPIH